MDRVKNNSFTSILKNNKCETVFVLIISFTFIILNKINYFNTNIIRLNYCLKLNVSITLNRKIKIMKKTTRSCSRDLWCRYFQVTPVTVI